MMLRISNFFTLMCLCHLFLNAQRLSASEGHSVGGGGELLQDSQNPWFIQNTAVVRYCTLYDFNFYHQSPEKSEAAIKDALLFWKEEFLFGQAKLEPSIKVATQQFEQVQCTRDKQDDVDLVFQFGFLTSEQRNIVGGDLSRFAAFALRMHYDPIALKGKGIIYIAADSGPDKFGDQDSIGTPWVFLQGALLRWTLKHELGHVFGLPHTNQSGEAMNIMAGNFIDFMMKRTHSSRYGARHAQHVFQIRKNNNWGIPKTIGCSGNGAAIRRVLRFFGIGDGNCVGFSVNESGLDIYATKGALNMAHFGTATINRVNGNDQSHTSFREALNFWLPPEQINLPLAQQVFPNARRIYAPSYHIQDFVATYRNDEGTIERQMSYTLDPTKDEPTDEEFKIGAMFEGQLFANLIQGI